MKHYFTLLLLVVTYYTFGQINFTDSNFKQALIDAGVDADNNLEISESEAKAINELDLYDKSINSLLGIEYFTNLINLHIGKNNLTEVNLSTLTQLKTLSLSDNQVTEIDLSNNTKLEHLSMQGNQLNYLLLSMLPKLKKVYINNNPIEGVIDVSNSTDLAFFQAASCPNLTKICVASLETVELGARYGAFVKSSSTVWSEECIEEADVFWYLGSSYGGNVVTNVSSKYSSEGLSVFPTLFTEDFKLEINEPGEFQLNVLDLSGQLVVQKTITEKGTYVIGDEFPKGNYIVKVVSRTKIFNFKVQKQ